MTPWTAAYQAPLSMGFSRQEYWSGVPLPSPKKVMQKAANKKRVDGTSLAVQGLTLLPGDFAGNIDLNPGWETKIPHASQHSQNI